MAALIYFVQGEKTLYSAKLLGLDRSRNEQIGKVLERSLYLTLVKGLWNEENGFYRELDPNANMHIELRALDTDALIYSSVELNMHPHNPVFNLGTTESSLNAWVFAHCQFYRRFKRFAYINPEEMIRYCLINGPKPDSLVQYAASSDSRLIYVLNHGFWPLEDGFGDEVNFLGADEDVPF